MILGIVFLSDGLGVQFSLVMAQGAVVLNISAWDFHVPAEPPLVCSSLAAAAGPILQSCQLELEVKTHRIVFDRSERKQIRIMSVRIFLGSETNTFSNSDYPDNNTHIDIRNAPTRNTAPPTGPSLHQAFRLWACGGGGEGRGFSTGFSAGFCLLHGRLSVSVLVGSDWQVR